MSICDNDSYLVLDFDFDVEPEVTDARTPHRCGEFHSRIDPHTGVRRWIIWHCKKYHECAICAAMKRNEIMSQVKPLIDSPGVRVRIIAMDDRAKVAREYGKDKYRQIPIDESTCYFLVDDADAAGEPLTPDMAQKIAQSAVPPKGKRISGSLGKKASAGNGPEVSDKAEVSRRVFRFEKDGLAFEDKEVLAQIDAEVIAETADLNPTTPEQVQYALYLLEEKTTEVAARHNVVILFLYTETIYCYPDKIDWSHRLNALKKE